MKKTILWLQELLISMGNALFHPYKDNSPPSFEAQPFSRIHVVHTVLYLSTCSSDMQIM
jgi:hypothetical protein